MRAWIAVAVAAGVLAGCNTQSAQHARVTAVDAHTGAHRWSVTLLTASASRPALADGMVVVAGTNDCNADGVVVTGLDSASGRRVWSASVPTSGGSCTDVQVTPLGTNLLVSAPGAGIVCASQPGSACPPSSVPVGVALDARTGAVRWRTPLAVEVVVAASDRGVVAVDQAGRLVGLDPTSGAQRWSTSAIDTPYAGTAVGPLAVLLGHSSSRPVARAVDLTTGRLLWRTVVPVTGGGFPPVLGTSVVLTQDDEGSQPGPPVPPGAPKPAFTPFVPRQVTIAYDPSSGRVRWQTEVTSDIVSTAEGGPLVVLARGSGKLSSVSGFDARSGVRRWRLDRADLVVVVATDGTSVVGSGGGVHGPITFGLDAATGRELWRTTDIASTLVIDGGTAYFTRAGRPAHMSDE